VPIPFFYFVRKKNFFGENNRRDSSQAGWPDWAIFRPLGDCLQLWAFFWKLKKLHKVLGFFSPWLRFCNNFDKKWVGQFFHMLINLVTLIRAQQQMAQDEAIHFFQIFFLPTLFFVQSSLFLTGLFLMPNEHSFLS
jgi:hypothetical protein